MWKIGHEPAFHQTLDPEDSMTLQAALLARDGVAEPEPVWMDPAGTDHADPLAVNDPGGFCDTRPSKSEEKLKIRSQSKKKSEEKEVAARSGDRHTPGPFRPSEGGGSTSPETSEDESSVETSAIRLMLKRRVQQMERPKSSLGSVRIEEFAGERYKYTKWKKAVEAQRQLCRLEEQELAMLVYLSTKQEARDCVYQVPISEFTRAGGLRLIWRLLDEALGESEEEQFERAEKEYNQYRRLPGQPVSAYIGQMKRLKAQSQRVDPETQISDRAWGQRLLNRGSLSRRERLDVFFSAGGLYEPAAIERALRHRCANTHEDERRVPTPYVAQKKPASYCASCGQKGHWRGQAPPEKATCNASSNAVHFTYVVTTTKKTKTTQEEKRTSGPMMSSCPHGRHDSEKNKSMQYAYDRLDKGKLLQNYASSSEDEADPYAVCQVSANGDGHYAASQDCGLKSVIYFSERHGAWVSTCSEEAPAQREILLTNAPGIAIMDSGCRTAVAGQLWHEMKELGLNWHEEPEQEMFQFGS
ncbi:Uncharacterized protein (Fragment) [Durusdinium trenchii]|uniref:Uncharacterized protein n=1 Tax=Durusdinium trenchii TaxID=1381693 RepID=A0ABP0L0Y7_9DINO